MPDYKKAIIYKIIDNTNDNVYIGSTCKTLQQRLASHAYNYKSYLNGDKKYMSSYKILVNKNFEIKLIETYPCNSMKELHQREGYHIKNIENIENCVNERIEGRTDAEYREDNKQQAKQYYEQNKEIIVEYKRQYYEQNKDKISERKRQYYEQNKDKILEQQKQKQKVICICGSEIRTDSKSRHERTNKHKLLLEQQA